MIQLEIPPGISELNDINSAFIKNFKFKADEKTIKTFLTTHHEAFCYSEFIFQTLQGKTI